MHGSGELIGQDLVDPALAGHGAFAREGLGDDGDMEVAFASLARPGMAGVQVRLVDHVQTGGSKGAHKLCADGFSDGAHGASRVDPERGNVNS